VGYLVTAIVIVYLLIWAISARFLSGPIFASFVQASYRSNHVIFAMAMIPLLMGPGALPTAALVIPFLSFTYIFLAGVLFTVIGLSADSSLLVRIKGIFIGFFTNPLILACILGALMNFSGLRLPFVLNHSFGSLANMAAPAAMLGLGGVMTAEKVRKHLRLAFACASVKNVLLPLAIIAPAIFLGFRGIELAIISMVALAPTATVTYATAVELGGDLDVAASCLVLSNGLALFTIVPALTLLRVLALF
jgi:predicted permease